MNSHSTSTRPWHAAASAAGVRADLPAQTHNSIAALIHERCTHFAGNNPKQKAFTCVMPNGMNGSLRFAEVDALSDAFASYLRTDLGLQAGDRVAVQLPNSLGYPVVAFGVFKAGCVLVNTNPLYTASEMVHQFNDAGARVLVIVDMFADKLPEVMANTKLEHVVVASVAEFFPAVPRGIIRAVQKVWSRVLPPVTVPHTRLKAALAKGKASGASAPAASFWKNTQPNDLAVLQYTGGTTGVSKGAMLTHSNILNNVQQMLAMGGTLMTESDECVLTALPLYHIFAFTANLLGFVVLGGHNILVPSPRPVQNLQRAVENYPITWMTGVNTLYNGLLNEEWFVAYPPKHLKASIAGGTALHDAVAQRWREVTQTPIAEGYGLTETSPVVSFNPLVGEVRLGSIGLPTPGTDMRLVQENGQDAAVGEPGEIWVKGPQVMLGYWNNESETANVMHDGWFATGDIGVMSADGFFKIVDRKKDMVLVSGFNVYPNEVEEVIAQLHAVLEVAVIGVPDSGTGEAVRAYIVPNPEQEQALDVPAVLAHCKQQLTSYKVPKHIEVVDELPKSPVGKVLRKDLRAQALASMNVKS